MGSIAFGYGMGVRRESYAESLGLRVAVVLARRGGRMSFQAPCARSVPACGSALIVSAISTAMVKSAPPTQPSQAG